MCFPQSVMTFPVQYPRGEKKPAFLIFVHTESCFFGFNAFLNEFLRSNYSLSVTRPRACIRAIFTYEFLRLLLNTTPFVRYENIVRTTNFGGGGGNARCPRCDNVAVAVTRLSPQYLRISHHTHII